MDGLSNGESSVFILLGVTERVSIYYSLKIFLIALKLVMSSQH